ncbi:hypothetical protein X805_27210 [Sphaerotilus natans subsp. natans DSM 6575]|uniref:Uncharacterized protein n=1 Tax=Sphaerotilus natans subsp. natans DSM 6575 TaxID=1286631 RepID=A0A059KKF1_9BURK|nr:hypothetical protein X805_27210 [Sphaerotilus natans subsp. natans DSM 6575]
MADRDEVRHRQAHAAPNPGGRHQRIDLAMSGVGRDHAHMLEREELLQRHRRPRHRMVAPEHAHVPVTEQPALKEACLQLRQQSDSQIDRAGLHVVAQVAGVRTQGADLDVGRTVQQRLHQRRHEIHLADVGHHQLEGAGAGEGVEGFAAEQRRLDRIERIGHRFGQMQRMRRGLHAARGAHEQLVAQQQPQPLQAVADTGLGQAQLVGRRGDAAVAQQLVKHHQQVQIDVAQFHEAGSPSHASLNVMH